MEVNCGGDEGHVQLLNPLRARSRAISLTKPSLIRSPRSIERTAMIAKRLFARFGFNCSLERVWIRGVRLNVTRLLCCRGAVVKRSFVKDLCEWNKIDG